MAMPDAPGATPPPPEERVARQLAVVLGALIGSAVGQEVGWTLKRGRGSVVPSGPVRADLRPPATARRNP